MTLGRIPVLSAALLLLAACADDELEGLPTAPPAPAGFEVRPQRLSFAGAYVGCVKRRGLSVHNTGDAPLVIELTPPSAPFAAGNLGPFELGPRATFDLPVTFAPQALGNAASSLRLSAGDAGSVDVPLDGVGLEVEGAAVDIVFVVDVSTSMDEEMIGLYDAIRELFDYAEDQNVDLYAGLTTFVNDVRVHRNGAPLSRPSFFAELDSQLTYFHTPDGELARNVANEDFPENVLDALYLAADSFAFRAGVPRLMILLTDDTFYEAPAEFSDGTPALHTYAQTLARLGEAQVALTSIHNSDLGAGLSTSYSGQPSLVAATGGSWHEVAGIAGGTLDLSTLIVGLVSDVGCL
jgi:hypothetical protein